MNFHNFGIKSHSKSYPLSLSITTEPSGQIGVALRCCLAGAETNKGVWVDTHDSNGAYSDRTFI